VGCGWCCLADQCVESHILHGYIERCPELYWDDQPHRYLCRLAAHPDQAARFRFLLAMGEGCCARFNTWRCEVRNRG